MDNASRSERTRAAALDAATAILAREGPGRLTLDAIARESGVSKGGLLHQFHSKEGVLKAVIARHTAHFEDFAQRALAELDPAHPQPQLAAQIATMREALHTQGALASALLGAMAEDPSLLDGPRTLDAEKVARVRAEAVDPDLALLRWAAARGLMLTVLMGLDSLEEAERERLFERLLDDRRWSGAALPPIDKETV